jgi:hypothetical protein
MVATEKMKIETLSSRVCGVGTFIWPPQWRQTSFTPGAQALRE